MARRAHFLSYDVRARRSAAMLGEDGEELADDLRAPCLESNTDQCPRCRRRNIQVQSEEFTRRTIILRLECLECGKEWSEENPLARRLI